MSAAQLWSAYIRYTGAGAVLAAGLITLARTIPTIVTSFKDSVKDFGTGAGAVQARTDRDLPLKIVLFGSLALAVFLVFAPGTPTQGNVLAAILIVLFGFFFVTVSSRITGLIGNSSNPISGMTIATLILTCTIFVGLGWIGDTYAPIALGVGAVVCIAAAIGGRHIARPEDRIHRRRHAVLAADRSRDRGGDVGVRHRHHDALPAPGDDDRIGFAARAAGDADVHDHPRAAQSEPAVGTRPRRRLHLGHARAVRHQVAAPSPSARISRSRRRLPSSLAASCGGGWNARPVSVRSRKSARARSSARGSSPAGRSPAFSTPLLVWQQPAGGRLMMPKHWGLFRSCTRERSGIVAGGLLFARWRSSSPGWGCGR